MDKVSVVVRVLLMAAASVSLQSAAGPAYAFLPFLVGLPLILLFDGVPACANQGGEIGAEYMHQSGSPTDGHVALVHRRMSNSVIEKRSAAFATLLNQRRSLRFFSRDPVPESVILNCIRAAGTAPSGAHCQPWRFCVVKSEDLKSKIRQAVEREEQSNYDSRMRKSWVADVEYLVQGIHGKDGSIQKPYLDEAPYIVAVMKQTHRVDADGKRVDNYYVEQSVGLAVGMFLAALTNANLTTLTSTPMGAEGTIRDLLGRPSNEKVFLLMPVGFPAPDATVPYRDDTTLRLPLQDIASFH
jgi:iodotyrosine deiodinase